MVDLNYVRGEIDRIDEELVKLLVRRLAVAREVALAKREAGRAVLDSAREEQVLERVATLAGPNDAAHVRQVYSVLFEISKARQCEILASRTGGEG